MREHQSASETLFGWPNGPMDLEMMCFKFLLANEDIGAQQTSSPILIDH